MESHSAQQQMKAVKALRSPEGNQVTSVLCNAAFLKFVWSQNVFVTVKLTMHLGTRRLFIILK